MITHKDIFKGSRRWVRHSVVDGEESDSTAVFYDLREAAGGLPTRISVLRLQYDSNDDSGSSAGVVMSVETVSGDTTTRENVHTFNQSSMVGFESQGGLVYHNFERVHISWPVGNKFTITADIKLSK